MKKIIFLILTAITVNFPSFANETQELSDMRAEEILSRNLSMDIPAPKMDVSSLNFAKSPNTLPALDVSLRLPFKEINKRLATLDISKVRAIDPNLPMLIPEGDSIVFKNTAIDYNGLEVEPVIVLKPYFEGKNKLAIKVKKIELDISFGPVKSLSFQEINKDEVMAMAMEKITTAVYQAMDKALSTNMVPLKAKDLIFFNYEKQSWTLHIAINPSFISPLMPGLINNINLSAFSFDKEGFTIKAGFNPELIEPDPLYNLSFSDGLITNFIKKFSDKSDFEILPQGHKGGLKFREDGKIEISGKMKVKDMPLKPNVYFTAEMLPIFVAQNVIRIRIDRINVDQAYGIGFPGFLNDWLQNKIITSTVESITNNPELKKTLSVRKIDNRTIEINFSDASFLPSFARGVRINGLKVKKGLLYLAFDF